VKFGIIYNTGYYGTDPGNLAAVARHAEERGFESFYVTEHIVLYPGRRPVRPSSRLTRRSPTRRSA
jgi:alkanesulfonate monooxygenase SsuD/methylene tetrahydromethanopterin reductase-like flavin-dependent oxidoreductase (luciferase family)